VKLKAKKELREHQSNALKAVAEGLPSQAIPERYNSKP